jgi:hypothetical protein
VGSYPEGWGALPTRMLSGERQISSSRLERMPSGPVLPVVPAADLDFLEEHVEFLSASEVTVFFLDAGHELADIPLPVVVVGVADKKIEVD